MDPTACWQLWDDYVCEGELEEAQYAAMDLIEWLSKGGFAPKWTDEQSKGFFNWVAEQEL